MRGKPWTDEDNKLLAGMVADEYTFEEIVASGKFPQRTADALRAQIQRLGLNDASDSNPSFKRVFVDAIEPAKDNLTMERTVKLFTTAFEQVCALKQVDKLSLERMRLIFQAAKDYGPLLAGYEKWDKVEKQIEELARAVADLQAAKGTAKAPGN